MNTETIPTARSDVRLETTRAADIPEYVRIMKAVESPLNLVTTDPAEALNKVQTMVSKKITQNGRIVGFVDYYAKSKNEVYIDEFAVDPVCQGQGIGKAVLDTLIDHFCTADMKKISLVTHPHNPALGLYKRHGFRAVDFIPDYEESGQPRYVLEIAF